ncbi:MAG: hypothetical protein IJY47_07155 [Clostridia bacterium]|nr:hypothetical protein [Clostridia bacterium]
MKKILSILLTLMMVVGTCTALVTATSAATNTALPKTWDFNNVSGTGTTLLNNIGWTLVDSSKESNLSATVEGGALRLKNSKDSNIYMLVCENEALKGAYTLQYDFKYAAKSDLPAAVGNYTQYNSKTDESGFFSGNNGSSVAGTWHVQPRLYGQLLNAPKSDANSWLNASRMSGNRFGTLSDSIVADQWFTVKIEYFPGNMVKASIKTQGASSWTLTDVYSDDQISNSSGTKGFITKYLRFTLGLYVDIYLDNISITARDYTPEVYGIQYKDSTSSFDMRMVATIKDAASTKVGYYVVVSFFDEATGGIRTATKNVECDYVYKSITFNDGNGTVTKTADQLREGMTYLFALHLEGIPLAETYSYHVIPYEVRNGETLYGTTKSFDRSLAKEKVPAYDTASGTVNEFIEFCAGGYYTRQVVGTTLAEFNAYATKLGNEGYTLYQSRDNVNGNYFRTFYNNFMMVHVYYMPAANTGGDFTEDVVRIVVSDTPVSDAFPKTPYGDTAVTSASMTFMAVDYAAQNDGEGGDNGLGVIFTNPDGSYVIVDGAWKYDTTALYNFLKTNNKRTDGKIVIRAWIITHPHQDHWGNIVEFAARYAGEKGYDGETYDYTDVTVEALVAQLSQQYCNANTQVYEGSKVIREAAAKLGAKTIVPQTGQTMYFGELEIEFLYTLESMLNPGTVQKYIDGVDGNEQSMIFRGRFKDANKTVLITGDSSRNESTHLDLMYYKHLRSDFVTLPHHGIDPTTQRFYGDSIQPLYVLVATSAEQAQLRYERSKSSWASDSGAHHYGTPTTGGSCVAIDYATGRGGAYYAADGEYRTFLIGAGMIPQTNDSVLKDAITFDSFFH